MRRRCRQKIIPQICVCHHFAIISNLISSFCVTKITKQEVIWLSFSSLNILLNIIYRTQTSSCFLYHDPWTISIFIHCTAFYENSHETISATLIFKISELPIKPANPKIQAQIILWFFKCRKRYKRWYILIRISTEMFFFIFLFFFF